MTLLFAVIQIYKFYKTQALKKKSLIINNLIISTKRLKKVSDFGTFFVLIV